MYLEKMEITTSFNSAKGLSIYASALDTLTVMFQANTATSGDGNIYLMNVSGFSNTTAYTTQSDVLSATYTEGMIVNQDNTFYIDFDTTSLRGMVTTFYDGSQNCDSNTLTTESIALSYSTVASLTGITLASTTTAYAFNGENHNQNNITSIAISSILGYCSSPYTVTASINSTTSSSSTVSESFFIDGTSNFTFYSSPYFSGGAGCADITFSYSVSDPTSAFGGGLYISSTGEVSVGPTYQTDGTHPIDITYTLSNGQTTTLTLDVTFTSCASATVGSFTTIISNQNYTVGGTYSAIPFTAATISNSNCTSYITYSLIQ
jgi:hypothetical protein